MIMSIRKTLSRLQDLHRDSRGTMVIETAIVAPVLVLMSIGGFEVSQMVARQTELQGGVAEAEAVVLAANMGAETKTTELKAMLQKSLGLSDDQVTVTKVYRCDASTSFVQSSDGCTNFYGASDSNSGEGNDAVVSTYIKLKLTDTYTPIWCRMGVSGPVDYKVERLVQLS